MKKRRETTIQLLACSVAVLIVVSGCIGQEEEKTTEPTITAAPEGPVSGGAYIEAMADDVQFLDPTRTSTRASIYVTRTIYDSLVVYGDDMSIQPSLAESWTVSDDGLQYVFNLRKDAKFHCGEPFTSEAVKYTIDKIMDPDEHSPIAYLYQEIENVEIPDDYTVVINMKAPNALLLENIAHYNFGLIVCPKCSEQYGEDFGVTAACGTGPFKFESRVPGSKLTVVRNEEYTWGPSCRSNTGPPYLDSITWRIIPEEATRLIELEAGNIDLARDISPESLAELVEAKGVNPLLYKPLNNWWYCFRIKDGSERSPLTADINVRKAVDYAIDKEGIIKSFMPGAILADSWLHPSVWGYDAKIKDYVRSYDPEKAKEVLEEAGWTDTNGDGTRDKDGRELILKCMTLPTTTWQNICTKTQYDLSQVGIGMDIEVYDSASFFSLATKGNWDIYLMNYRFSNADILYYQFHSSQAPAPNRIPWEDEETDRILAITRSSTDSQERLDSYFWVQKMAVENCLTANLFYEKGIYGVSDNLHIPSVHDSEELDSYIGIWKEPSTSHTIVLSACLAGICFILGANLMGCSVLNLLSRFK